MRMGKYEKSKGKSGGNDGKKAKKKCVKWREIDWYFMTNLTKNWVDL
jgi:hypothetical protein